MNLQERVQQAEFLRQKDRGEEAMRICMEVLNDKVDCPEALYVAGHCLIDSGKYGLAHAVFMQFIRVKPNVPNGWNNLGRCYEALGQIDEAERCFRRAVRLDDKDEVAWSNLGLMSLHRCESQEAIRCTRKALSINSGLRTCRFTLGLAQLLEQNWKEGWENFESSVGYNADRRERCFTGEERWDGTKGKTVVAYGEQGIGDEISFASCIPDFIKDCSEAVIECDKRLAGLFKRSFPRASVYGTRFSEVIDWADRHTLDGRVAFGSLPKYYRNKTEDFPGTPYLVADPQLRLQYKALLDSLGPKPKIGISWQGGSKKTGKLRRSVSLEALLPVLRQDATFISVQYKDAKEEVQILEEMYGIKVHHWPRIVENKDYDETAALVAELDCVVSVTTAVIHLSGALGVPCIVLTPKNPRWFYGLQGESLPWYKSVELIRQKRANDWLDSINEAAVRLRKYLHGDHQLHESSGRVARVA